MVTEAIHQKELDQNRPCKRLFDPQVSYWKVWESVSITPSRTNFRRLYLVLTWFSIHEYFTLWTDFSRRKIHSHGWITTGDFIKTDTSRCSVPRNFNVAVSGVKCECDNSWTPLHRHICSLFVFELQSAAAVVVVCGRRNIYFHFCESSVEWWGYYHKGKLSYFNVSRVCNISCFIVSFQRQTMEMTMWKSCFVHRLSLCAWECNFFLFSCIYSFWFFSEKVRSVDVLHFSEQLGMDRRPGIVYFAAIKVDGMEKRNV